MKVDIFQFNGCDKCFNETLLIKSLKKEEITRIKDPKKWKPEDIDIAIITGYLLPENKVILEQIHSKSKQVIAYGNCTVTGGVFGLAYQKGIQILPIHKALEDVVNVEGCLAEVEELDDAIKDKVFSKTKNLCEVCSRKSTCDYLESIVRQVDLEEDTEKCFNDMGYLCNGYVAKECKEMCINYGAACRGCKPNIDRASFRMLGMFGTLMGNMEVATEATGKGGTDKLADADDDLTDSLPDISGNFFRFQLADTYLPIGKMPPNGSVMSDTLNGRLIEELPMILGLIGGSKAISLTLDAIQAYESASEDIEVSDKTKELRKQLLDLEKQLQEAISKEDAKKYQFVTTSIRKIAGNMNLSNVFFGGFRTAIDGEDDYSSYKYKQFEIQEGVYQSGAIKYRLDPKGIISEFNMEEK